MPPMSHSYFVCRTRRNVATLRQEYTPSTAPALHDTLAEATAEAERLAIANPGVTFTVVRPVSESTAPAPEATTSLIEERPSRAYSPFRGFIPGYGF